MERRTFLATALAAPLRAAPSDRVNVAVVGVRGRGRDHIREYGTRADSRVAAVCDIDDGVAASAAELAAKTQGGAAPKIYKDIRALLANKDPAAALKAYEAKRSPATAHVVLTNRKNPPDAILREVWQRTGDKPFNDIDAVISKAEIMAISDGYKQVAGYDRESLRA